jgi:hypothetical protein
MDSHKISTSNDIVIAVNAIENADTPFNGKHITNVNMSQIANKIAAISTAIKANQNVAVSITNAISIGVPIEYATQNATLTRLTTTTFKIHSTVSKLFEGLLVYDMDNDMLPITTWKFSINATTGDITVDTISTISAEYKLILL